MKEFSFRFEPDTPEQCAVSFYSSGYQGGDAGHGGSSSLTLYENGSNLNLMVDIKLQNGKEIEIEDVESVSLTVFGDWELAGLAVAFMDLGRKLMARDDVLKAYSSMAHTE